jgi:hypothetical protein
MNQKVQQINPDWEAFIRQRLNDLHQFAFSDAPYGCRWDPQSILVGRCAYFTYSKLLNDHGLGTDYSKHPNNPFNNRV